MANGVYIGTGNGVNTNFPMPNHSALTLIGTDSTLAVYVGGTYSSILNQFTGGTLQANPSNYSISGSNLVFVSAPTGTIYGNFQTLDRGN
jgi:hypothetical protein